MFRWINLTSSEIRTHYKHDGIAADVNSKRSDWLFPRLVVLLISFDRSYAVQGTNETLWC